MKNVLKKKIRPIDRILITSPWYKRMRSCRKRSKTHKKNFLTKIIKLRKWKNSKKWPSEIKTTRRKPKNRLQMKLKS